MMETDYIREDFISYVKELFENKDTDNILDKLISKFNLAGRHTASRRITRYFGKSYFDLLRDYKLLGSIDSSPLGDEKDFKQFISNQIAQLTQTNYGPIVMKTCAEYKIDKREFHKRFLSLFGKTISEYVNFIFEPDKEEIEKAFLLSDNSDEFFKTLGIESGSERRSGFFQRHFGYSTFISAKAKVMFSREFPKYSPTKDDNKSILYSQYIGDGCYDKIRNSFRIDHGIKQFDYLKLKVQLFNKAFPETAGLESLKKKVHGTQGFEFASWYSRKLPHFEIYTKAEMIDKMTPLGILLLYLDDGCLSSGQLNIASCDPTVVAAINKKMLSYGIKGFVAKSAWSVASKLDIIKFLHMFVLPYEDIIPPCMMYKYDLKI